MLDESWLVVGINIADIAAKLLDVFFLYEIIDYSSTAFFVGRTRNVERIFGGRERFVGVGLGVVVGKLHGRNSVCAPSAWNGQILNGLCTTDTRKRVLEIVGYFWVINLKTFWPIHCRCLQQFHIASSLNSECESNSFVGLQIGIGYAAVDSKLTDASTETRGFASRQFGYVYCHTWCCKWLSYSGITVEEIIEDTTYLGAILYAEYRLELRRINYDVATALREE